MTEVKHTPTPWKAVSNESYWTIVPENRRDDSPYQIGDVCSSYPYNKDQGLQQANAAHIVKCVNLHDELVEALQFISECNMTNSQDFKQVAREALKKAGSL